MSFVVSANYLERASDFRWLFRRDSEDADAAVAARYLCCEGVTFGDAPEREVGFGCEVVAFCRDVLTSRPARFDVSAFQGLGAVQLRFRTDKFLTIEGDREVVALDFLELHRSGKLYGYAPKFADAADREAAAV